MKEQEEQEKKIKAQKVKLEKKAMAMLSALIGQKTKKEASFAIKGWVREIQNKTYKIEIGKEQGVKLDDFYYLMLVGQQLMFLLRPVLFYRNHNIVLF